MLVQRLYNRCTFFTRILHGGNNLITRMSYTQNSNTRSNSIAH